MLEYRSRLKYDGRKNLSHRLYFKQRIVERKATYLLNSLKKISQIIKNCEKTTHFGKCSYLPRPREKDLYIDYFGKGLLIGNESILYARC